MRTRSLISAALCALLLFLSACSYFTLPSGPRADDLQATQNALIVQAAQATATGIAMQAEISRLQTQVAQGNAAQSTVVAGKSITITPQIVVVTATPLPPTETSVPTATPPATNTPTISPTPTVTITTIPCNAVQFVRDISIPDGTTLSPGTTFTKTWRLKNIGACGWTTSYSVVFSSGDAMNAPASVNLPSSVAPGQEIDVSVKMTAPSEAKTYRGNWKMRDASGIVFGLGKTGSTFYVEIKVSQPESKYPLDFVAQMCQAEWSSGAGTLDCPGANNDSRGFVYRQDNPVLESGSVDNEPALLTSPQLITDGVIRGKYPAFRVESGHHFAALIDCEHDAKSCDVTFQLDYQIGSGSIQTLKSWHEVYEGNFNQVDVDLSTLAGKDVKFILTVFANGSPNQDRAQWLAPRIYKK